VQEVFGQGFPQADVSITVVWIDMLDADNAQAARGSARILDDPRVVQFHDPERRVGEAIATRFGAGGHIAWDVYLFYPQGSTWGASPPLPVEWMHQLDDTWADPARFYWDRDLLDKLHEIAGRLTGLSRGMER
jgi:hypothetical protein